MAFTCQILLIAFCAFLRLAPGDATTCHVCSSLNDVTSCKPEEGCEMDENGACAAARVYDGEKQVALLRGCWPDKSDLCGSKEEYPDNKAIEMKCCDSDSCNETL